MVTEQTFVLLKPDSIQRSVIGKIITRFEDADLKIVAMKMLWASQEQAEKHYPFNEIWARQVYEKTKKVYEEKGEKFGYKNHIEHGQTIRKWNISFLRECPVLAIVLEGPHAVEIVRKMVGATEPRQANPGTIRGDFAVVESYTLADTKKRPLRNLIHASDTIENAKHEIAVWFDNKEIYKYAKELDKHL
jgi:nucleoside-diphosphate kinase